MQDIRKDKWHKTGGKPDVTVVLSPQIIQKTLDADMQTRIGELQQALVDGDTEGAKTLCKNCWVV